MTRPYSKRYCRQCGELFSPMGATQVCCTARCQRLQRNEKTRIREREERLRAKQEKAMRYSDYEQRQLDIESGKELDRASAKREQQQVDIKTASFRILSETPGHITYGVWINGGKSGNLVVRQEERVAFHHLLERAGFTFSRTTS